jgi:Glycosyltransferase WbsX
VTQASQTQLRLPQDLAQMVDTASIRTPSDLTVACYTFPHFHPSQLNYQMYGNGWTEYILTRGARPWFPGHQQPRTPMLGELDERKPATWEVYFDLARQHGVDAFIFDWYWYGGRPCLHEALEEGFLGSRNRDGVQFAVMWTNHPWAIWFETAGVKPTSEWLVIWASEVGAWEPTHAAPESAVDVWRSLSYIIARYFHEPGYWHIDGKPILFLWDLSLLLRTFGIDGTKALLDDLRAFARKLGHEGIHVHAVCQEPGMVEAKHHIKEVGADSYGIYNSTAMAVGGRPKSEDILDFQVLAADVVSKVWPDFDALIPDLPYFPAVSPGCDDTPRHVQPPRSETPDRSKWPATVISVNDTPDTFEALVRAALAYLNDHPDIPQVLTIGSWNEWTEGHYLLPDTRYGFGMLRALARALGHT